MFTLRPYQREAVDATIKHFDVNPYPALIVAATGAGKSLIVAELAKHYGTALVLHPSKELCEQNALKYASYELNNHSIYCAGLGEKSNEGDVIFATHQSLDVDDMPEIKILIVDEAHKFTKAVIATYTALLKRFPDLLMLGLTATPYLIGKGFIYQQEADGRVLTPEEARDPFFLRCVYDIDAETLISGGYLSPIVMGDVDGKYDGTALEVTTSGWFSAESVEKATTSDRNATGRIATQILRVMQHRIACMVFVSSIEHGKAFMELMPRGRARFITGETPAHQRRLWLKSFRAGMYDILVNVATLTTGVDLPLVDTIAIMRFTESAALWQQIAGRGMRLSPETGKSECLLMDFTDNPDTFFPSGNVYRPEVRSVRERTREYLDIECPTCAYVNKFVLAHNEMGLPITPDGYFADLTGRKVINDDGNPVIAHHGRRCQFIDDAGERCNHRFIAKVCPSCKTNNDIAAKKCSSCSKPLVDWNRNLKSLATRLPEKESKVGTWSIGRVERVEREFVGGGLERAAFHITKRKKPVRKWLKGTPTLRDMLFKTNGAIMPHAIAFRKNLKGQTDVRVLWTALDLDKFTQAET